MNDVTRTVKAALNEAPARAAKGRRYDLMLNSGGVIRRIELPEAVRTVEQAKRHAADLVQPAVLIWTYLPAEYRRRHG